MFLITSRISRRRLVLGMEMKLCTERLEFVLLFMVLINFLFQKSVGRQFKKIFPNLKAQ